MRLLLPDKCQEGVGNRKIVIKLLLYFILFVKQVAVLHIKLQLDTNLIYKFFFIIMMNVTSFIIISFSNLELE